MDIALLTALGAGGLSELAANLPLTATPQNPSQTAADAAALYKLSNALDPYIEKTGGTADVIVNTVPRTPVGDGK